MACIHTMTVIYVVTEFNQLPQTNTMYHEGDMLVFVGRPQEHSFPELPLGVHCHSLAS